MALARTDPFMEDKKDYAHVSPLWLSNLVDIYNSAMTELEAELASIEARLTAGGL